MTGQTMGAKPLLEVRDMKMWFPLSEGLIRRRVKGHVKAVDGVSFSIAEGETLGLVGESGCGKTTAGRCVLRLEEPTSGKVLFDGEDVLAQPESRMRALRKEMQVIFQDPFGSLNPRMTVEGIVADPLIVNGLVSGRGEMRDRVAELLHTVGLNPSMARRYPHQFSGGQRQRIGIARALAVEPRFIVCDEAVSALDVSIQAQIVNLFKELQARLNLTYLFIAHDLAVVRHISDNVAVMYLGRIMEIAPSDEVYANPLHPYTRALLSAVPIPDPVVEESRRKIILTGDVPNPANPPAGCVFHTRCPMAAPECRDTRPELREILPGHSVACLRA